MSAPPQLTVVQPNQCKMSWRVNSLIIMKRVVNGRQIVCKMTLGLLCEGGLMKLDSRLQADLIAGASGVIIERSISRTVIG